MRLMLNIGKGLFVTIFVAVAIFVLFAPQISAFWYNRYEAPFSVEFTKVLRQAASIEDMIDRRKQIAGAIPSDFNDMNWLKNEVLAQLSSEKNTLDLIDKIDSKQSRIPLLESRLTLYHQKKLAWAKAQRKSLEQFIDVKNTEYRVYDLSSSLFDIQQLVKPPANMDMKVWNENSIKAAETVRTILESIQNATEDNILIPEYEKSLVSTARGIEAVAQLNLRAMAGEITWDDYLIELKKANDQYPQETFESALQLASKWRIAIIDAKNKARQESYDQADAALLAMSDSTRGAPLLSDSITTFLVKRGWLTLPKTVSDEPKEATLLASELEQFQRMITNPDVLFFRKALNAYSNGDTSICITTTARKKVESNMKLSGLDLFDPAYYKSKFTPIATGNSNPNQYYVRVLFVDKPDRIFTGTISLSGDKRCLEYFVTDDEENNTAIPEFIIKYKKYIFDPQYEL